jgi:predicted ArsR family transcriptional regulator
MDNWWADLDNEILAYVNSHGAVACADVARELRISEEAAASLLGMLARESKIRLQLSALPVAQHA